VEADSEVAAIDFDGPLLRPIPNHRYIRSYERATPRAG